MPLVQFAHILSTLLRGLENLSLDVVKYATQYTQRNKRNIRPDAIFVKYAIYAIWAKRLILSAVNLQNVKQRKLTVPTRFLVLRTVPTIVIAHTFCASRDTRISYR